MANEQNTTTQSVHDAVNEIQILFEKFGNEDYDGEPVSQTSHMLQAGMHGVNEQCDDELVLGGFLHDIGHLLRHEQNTQAMGTYGVVNHEGLGAEYLRRKGFTERVCAMVDGHVNAKRYLVATDPKYASKLSLASHETLKWQGGPMTEEEAQAFKKQPYFPEIIRVRLWDEKAKDQHAKTYPLEYFINLIRDYLTQRQGSKPMVKGQ